jgi:hypothetical protein
MEGLPHQSIVLLFLEMLNMKNVIIYTNSNGVISVVSPSPSYKGTVEELAVKTVPTGLTYFEIESVILPKDLTLELAWEICEDSVRVNPDKAKAIWKDKWREARKPLLASLDIEFMKAVETADTEKQAEIALKKQELRDVTNTPILGTTPEEIKSVWPEVLNDPN